MSTEGLGSSTPLYVIHRNPSAAPQGACAGLLTAAQLWRREAGDNPGVCYLEI